jgi:hypothetical protein
MNGILRVDSQKGFLHAFLMRQYLLHAEAGFYLRGMRRAVFERGEIELERERAAKRPIEVSIYRREMIKEPIARGKALLRKGEIFVQQACAHASHTLRRARRVAVILRAGIVRALPSRTQITRHDCVEGWSAIGKWKGVPLSTILDAVKPKPEARFVVFHCADPMEDDGTQFYYESVDMEDAHHPQTILAYELNDKTLPIPNGAPIRVRIKRQLGYKQAKFIMRIELVESFEKIGGGKGGYWED